MTQQAPEWLAHRSGLRRRLTEGAVTPTGLTDELAQTLLARASGQCGTDNYGETDHLPIMQARVRA